VTDLVANLLEMMKEGEQTDPIDFAELPFDDDKLREMVLHSVLGHFGTLQREGLSAQDINTVYLISTSKLILENLVLNMRLLIAQGRRGEPGHAAGTRAFSTESRCSLKRSSNRPHALARHHSGCGAVF
jgi:hypothetical protein